MKSDNNRKVLFVHDGPLYQDETGRFYGTGFNDAIRKRYLALGTEVSFLMRLRYKESKECENFNQIKREKFDVISVPNFKSFANYFKLRRKAKNIVREAVKRHDIIIARLPSATGSLAVHYANKYKKPLLTEMVACTKDTYWYHSLKGKMIAHYFYYKQRAIMRTVNYCIYVTDRFLQERYPINGKLIACSDVHIHDLEDKVLKERLSKIEMDNAEKPLILGSVGKLSMRLKGHTDVIRALSHLKKRGIIFHYHLVGGGDNSHLQELIKKSDLEEEVTILGPLSHAEVFAFFDGIDIYIQPSRTEGLPRAMVEAMSRACPVMGSAVGGIPELAHSGSLFKAGDAKQIADRLLSFDRPKLLQEASRSYHKAREYESGYLRKKRNLFYNTFLIDNKFTINE